MVAYNELSKEELLNLKGELENQFSEGVKFRYVPRETVGRAT